MWNYVTVVEKKYIYIAESLKLSLIFLSQSHQYWINNFILAGDFSTSTHNRSIL